MSQRDRKMKSQRDRDMKSQHDRDMKSLHDRDMKSLHDRDMKSQHETDLKDGRWLRRRVEILVKRDFRCDMCGDDWFLQVHHKRYVRGRRLWEYGDEELMCLCGRCHELQHELRPLRLKGDYLLLPLEYYEEAECFLLPNVGDLCICTGNVPRENVYLLVTTRGRTERVVGKSVLTMNVARVSITASGLITYTARPRRWRADPLSTASGGDSVLVYMWDNKDHDASYKEFTELPAFEYDLSVVYVGESGVQGWHRGTLCERFKDIRVL